MNKTEKTDFIEVLKNKFAESQFFYITDSSALTVEEINNFRRKCFESDVEMQVLKNTLVKKALESADESKGFGPLMDVLKGPTSVMFTTKANEPAKILEAFRKSHDKPVLKAAYIDTDVYIGDESIKELANLKSKEDLIGEVIVLLQSPIKTVIGSLQSGEQKIAGLVKALQERAE